MHRHLLVPPLYMKPTVRKSVVEPLLVVGAVTVLFSVFTHVMVWATAEKSRTRTIVIWPSTADAVVIVMVRVAAELLVTVLRRNVTGTVAALPEAVIALLTSMMLLNFSWAVKVWASPRVASVAEDDGKVMVAVPLPVSVMSAPVTPRLRTVTPPPRVKPSEPFTNRMLPELFVAMVIKV